MIVEIRKLDPVFYRRHYIVLVDLLSKSKNLDDFIIKLTNHLYKDNHNFDRRLFTESFKECFSTERYLKLNTQINRQPVNEVE